MYISRAFPRHSCNIAYAREIPRATSAAAGARKSDEPLHQPQAAAALPTQCALACRCICGLAAASVENHNTCIHTER